ncbi:hypothetical protein [Blastococcus brunescens]|uniref:Uncharacterized protein n=1 Tax=Blastococcus brunescens TaxID=1564165 RepID=A0ABZ1B3F7_9ACTN|nr:hypothetical protein [Blastococcus sp. BMG 8361]WRL64313.1 hypothetical protein U6N30_00120 [Blastococcus sp. BMG 8361]
MKDRAALEDALRSIRPDNSAAQWCRSVDTLAGYLEEAVTTVRESLSEAAWWDVRQRRRNAAALETADRAIVAVGVVLVDVLKKRCLPASYHIGRYLATEVKR